MQFFKKAFAAALVCSALFASHSFANEAAAGDDWDESGWVNVVPSTSWWGLRGLSQTVSAEPLGAGRFNLALFTSYFKQQQEIIAPAVGVGVNTWRGALTWGLNDNVDLFGVIPAYILFNDHRGQGTSGGSLAGLIGGAQLSLRSLEGTPFRFAGQLAASTGIRTGIEKGAKPGERQYENEKNKDITTNPNYWREEGDGRFYYDGADQKENWNYAGYDFWEARNRDQVDMIFKLAETFILHPDEYVKLHINEGIVVTMGSNEYLLLMAGGLQVDPTDFLTVGLETSWRTRLGNPSFEDPFWLTLSGTYRSPYYTNVGGYFGWSLAGGVDICLSSAKSGYEAIRNNNNVITGWRAADVKPLEPWRIFGDLVLSFDRYAPRRTEIEREKRRSEAEKARLKREAELTSAQKDSLARKAREDSLRLAQEMADRAAADSLRAKHIADSLAAAMGDMADKARQDSIAQAQAAAAAAAAAAQREAELLADAEAKHRADSLALAEAKRRLEEERAKRSEAENMLLTTGMLILDAVYFNTGRADIHLNSRPYLTTIAKMLAKYPKLKLEIGGHTDNTGKFETNMSLSQQRSEAVFMFMHSVEPVLAQMLSAKGYGPTMPKADNNTAAGREMNRRVELKVLNPDVLKDYNP